MLSIRLTHAIRLSPERNWRIAARSGLQSRHLVRTTHDSSSWAT